MIELRNDGIDWTKSREVYEHFQKQGIETGVAVPVVMELSGNIILNDKIVGNFRDGNIIVYEEDIQAAVN